MKRRSEGASVDVLIVGAGVLGLTHAAEAVGRGLSVAVVERDQRAVGASLQNFGHVSITAQSGVALELGRASRLPWLALGRKAGFDVAECGTVVLARADAEAALLEEFAAGRDAAEVQLLRDGELDELLPTRDPRGRIGAFLPIDLRVDPREAIPRITGWLEASGVQFHWSTTVGELGDGIVSTNRGELAAAHVIVCVGHHVDRLAPAVAETVGHRRCHLQMLEVDPIADRRMRPALLSGTSMVRYSGLAGCPSAARVARRLFAEEPRFRQHQINLMVTSRPDGGLVIGDSHHYDATPTPFEDEAVARLLLCEAAQLLGVPELRVRARWRGMYASSPDTDFLVHDLGPRTHLVTVTAGLGMTTAPALAAATFERLDTS